MSASPLRKDVVTTFFVVSVCVANIIYVFPTHNNLSILNSIIGLTGVFLYWRGNRHFANLLWIWAASQAFVVQSQHIDLKTFEVVTNPKLDMRQFSPMTFLVGPHIGNAINGEVSFNFNLTVLLYLTIPAILRANFFLGKTIKLIATGANPRLNAEAPILLTFSNIVRIGGKQKWLLGVLNKPISLGEVQITHLLVPQHKGFLGNQFKAPEHNFRILPGEKLESSEIYDVEGLVIDASKKTVFV